MKQRTRREAQAEWRRNQLLDTALRLFGEKGVENTSIKDIAEEAGIAQGLVYHYFRSKEDLLVEVLQRRSPMPALRDLLASLQGQPATEVLPMLARGIYALMTERRDILSIMFREVIVNPPMIERLSDFREEMFSMVARYLETRIAAGELRPHNPHTTVQTLATSIMVLRVMNLPPEPYITELVETLLHGLLAPDHT
ncbi:MAG TPA: helix-turn-helix domain-containing protein [Ktedonobacterales bacterium]|jgi:AcrR family transcriptional regulator|nr:helix-turn-helix domain-containing protein [Ktedonobacterales bacterium]